MYAKRKKEINSLVRKVLHKRFEIAFSPTSFSPAAFSPAAFSPASFSPASFSPFPSPYVQLLIVASDVESIKSSGGLDDVMDQILQLAKEQDVFTVFTMSRFPLGKLMKKPVPVSCVGVKDFGGCESIVKELKKKVLEKTREYEEKVREIMALESEAENPSAH